MQAHNLTQYGPNKLGQSEHMQIHYYDANADKFIFLEPPSDMNRVLGYNPTTQQYAWFEASGDTDYIYVNDVVAQPTYDPAEETPDMVLYKIDLTSAISDYNVRFHLGTEHTDAGAYTLSFGDGSPQEVVSPDGTYDSIDHLFQQGNVYIVQITGSMDKLSLLAVLNATNPTQFVPITEIALPESLPELKTFTFMGAALTTWDFVTANNHSKMQCLELSFNDNVGLAAMPDFTLMPNLSFLRVSSDSLTTVQLDLLLSQLDSVLLTPANTSLDIPLFPIHDEGHIYINNNDVPSTAGLLSIASMESRSWVVHLT